MKSTKRLKLKAYTAVVLFCYPVLFLILWSRGRLVPYGRYQPRFYAEVQSSRRSARLWRCST